MTRTVGTLVATLALIAGCATAPKTAGERSKLEIDASQTLQAMAAKDPAIEPLMNQAAGYIVFPEVKQGGFVVGGASGKGVVFEGGRMTGFAQLSQAQIGALVGGQKFAELVIVRDHATLESIKAGQMKFGAEASAVILKAGATATTRFDDRGVAVIVDPSGGAMLNLSLSGQNIKAT